MFSVKKNTVNFHSQNICAAAELVTNKTNNKKTEWIGTIKMLFYFSLNSIQNNIENI